MGNTRKSKVLYDIIIKKICIENFIRKFVYNIILLKNNDGAFLITLTKTFIV